MGILSKINEKRKQAQKKIFNPIVKGISKVSDKFLPNEFRFMAPYAAGIGTLMLPGTMGPLYRALAAGGMNIAGQIGADETPIEDISDLNALSVALAGGMGALGSNEFSKNMRLGIDKGYNEGLPYKDPMSATGGVMKDSPGFLQGAENVTREGLASLGDYVTGSREALANLGKNPGDLFSSADKFKGARDAAAALGPTISQGTGDVFREAAIDWQDEADRLRAEEEADIARTTTANEGERANLQMTFMRQAGHDEETVKETLDMNDLGEYYTPPTESAAQGGIIGLKEGGRINFNSGGSDIFGIGGEEVIPKMGEKMGEGASFLSDLITDSEGNVYTVLQYLRKFGEDAFFGGQKNPELSEKFYNKLGDDYIQEMETVKERGYNTGGIIGLKEGGMLNFGGREMDLRGGGFVPIGRKERADDVPARLSKNEFVMTADAVRAAGGGSVNKGAQRMYDVMNNLEARA